MSRVVLPALEAIGGTATRRRRAGERAPLRGALVETLDPVRVLMLGAGADDAATDVIERSPRLETLVAIDRSAETASGLAARAADAARRAGRPRALTVERARLLGRPPGAPHFTRVPALVEALRGPGFDLVLVAPPSADADLYPILAQAVPLLAPDGVLCLAPLDRAPGTLATIRRIVTETAGPAVLWQPEGDVPAAALLGIRRPLHNHEESGAWCAAELGTEPALAAARAAGDHAAVSAAIRHWLSCRLVWSTRDLLLPLTELPPALGVYDVIDRCARSEGGVWGFGAAVALAMLYRACGYPATVYQYGLRDLFWHMATLVQLPDGRILVEDALFDAELRLGGEAIDWREAVALVHGGRAGVLSLPSALAAHRPHLYSRASLTAAEADGYLSAAERRTLEEAMEGCQRFAGEPRAGLVQPFTTSLAAFTRVPVHARALDAVRARTGIDQPLALLGLPCGALPLSGDATFDRDIVQALDEWDRLARALAVGA